MSFANVIKFIKNDFNQNKPILLKKLQDIFPEAQIVDIAIGGSIAKGTATEESDVDIEVYYTGNVSDKDVWFKLSKTISGCKGFYDIVPRKRNGNWYSKSQHPQRN